MLHNSLLWQFKDSASCSFCFPLQQKVPLLSLSSLMQTSTIVYLVEGGKKEGRIKKKTTVSYQIHILDSAAATSPQTIEATEASELKAAKID